MSSTEFSKSSYIVYLISSPVRAMPHSPPQGHEAKRRYSEFEALRDALVQLHPTLIIPPIPSKHSILDYATKQGRAKNDPAMIARRKRMLERFLQRLDMHPVLRMDVVFRRFLDPRYTWHEIAHTPPITTLPRHNLNAPPQNPADPDAPSCYSFLPTPSAPLKLHAPDAHFQEADAFTHRFGHAMASTLEPANRRLVHRWGDIATDLADLGALLNAQSLAEQSQLASAMERTGQAVDTMQVALSGMLHAWEAQVTEPIAEYTQYASILSKVLQWRHLKHQQLEVACDLIESKHQRLAELEKEEAHAARLNRALETGGSSLVSRRNTHAQRSVYSRAAESEPEEAEEETPEVDTSADDLTSMWARKAAPAPQPPRQRSLLDTFTNRFASVMDLDSDKSRHSSISRLREEVVHVRCITNPVTRGY